MLVSRALPSALRRARTLPSALRRCGFATSSFPEAKTVWKDGALIPWADANVHILSTAVQFGSSLFEGMRCYATSNGPAIVHLHGHLRRLIDSCKMYRIEVPYSQDQLAAACFDVVEANGLTNGCYIRPMVLRGYGGERLSPNAARTRLLMLTCRRFAFAVACSRGHGWPRLADRDICARVGVGRVSWSRRLCDGH